MYKHILVFLDGTSVSEQALKQGIALAKHFKAALNGLSVIEKLPAYAATLGEVEEVVAEAEDYFTRIHAMASESAQSAGVSFRSLVRVGNPVAHILRVIQQQEIDLIIFGGEDRPGLSGLADKITEQAQCSVLIARAALQTLRVKDIMTSKVVTVNLATPLEEIADLLLKKGLKAAPVVEGEKVVGMITGGDLLDRAGMGLRLSLQRLLSPQELAEQKKQLATSVKTAGDIMTTPAIVIEQNEKITRAARLMAERQVKRLPVVDEKGALVGILSRLDVISTLTAAAESDMPLPEIPEGVHQMAGDIMFRSVATVGPETPLNEVLNRIVATPLRRVVVVDAARRVIGVISDADFLVKASAPPQAGLLNQIISWFSKPASQNVVHLSGVAADILQKEVFFAGPETPISEIVKTMIEKRVKRLVVVDDQSRLLGMVDRESILRVIASF